MELPPQTEAEGTGSGLPSVLVYSWPNFYNPFIFNNMLAHTGLRFISLLFSVI